MAFTVLAFRKRHFTIGPWREWRGPWALPGAVTIMAVAVGQSCTFMPLLQFFLGRIYFSCVYKNIHIWNHLLGVGVGRLQWSEKKPDYIYTETSRWNTFYLSLWNIKHLACWLIFLLFKPAFLAWYSHSLRDSSQPMPWLFYLSDSQILNIRFGMNASPK